MREAQLIVDGAIPGLEILDFIREQAEEATGGAAIKQHPSVTSASASRVWPCLISSSDFFQ